MRPVSPDHPQRRQKRTRKIVGKPSLPPSSPKLPDPPSLMWPYLPPPLSAQPYRVLYDSAPPPRNTGRLTRIRSWLADRCAALARWLRP